jgi:hypothetical protein
MKTNSKVRIQKPLASSATICIVNFDLSKNETESRTTFLLKENPNKLESPYKLKLNKTQQEVFTNKYMDQPYAQSNNKHWSSMKFFEL